MIKDGPVPVVVYVRVVPSEDVTVGIVYVQKSKGHKLERQTEDQISLCLLDSSYLHDCTRVSHWIPGISISSVVIGAITCLEDILICSVAFISFPFAPFQQLEEPLQLDTEVLLGYRAGIL